MKDQIEIDGVSYVRMPKKGELPRVVLVVDRGWIFAGDIDESVPNWIKLTRVAWVFRWEVIGFAEVLAHPEKADIRPIKDVVIPANSEIFRIPVDENWGL